MQTTTRTEARVLSALRLALDAGECQRVTPADVARAARVLGRNGGRTPSPDAVSAALHDLADRGLVVRERPLGNTLVGLPKEA